MRKFIKNNKVKMFLFQNYSWCYNILFIIMEFFPPVFRNFLYKMMLRNMGSNVMIDYKTYIRYPRQVSLGSNIEINRGCQIIPGLMASGSEIIFKDNIHVSPNVSFFSTGHDYSKKGMPDIGERIIINSHCWIGGGSIILPGVEIGEGCVIGAGSVVTKSVPPYSVAVGVPARIIKKRHF